MEPNKYEEEGSLRWMLSKGPEKKRKPGLVKILKVLLQEIKNRRMKRFSVRL